MAAPRPLSPQFALTAALLAWGLAPDPIRPRFADALRLSGRNLADLDRMEAGYYEHLLDTGRRLDEAAIPPPPPPFKDGPLALRVDDLRECVLVPGLETTFQGARWTTSSLGLRDLEYEAAKPADTVRVVLVGDSIGVGWGVDDGRGFEPLLERALDSRSIEGGGPRVEILNLCVPGHAPGQRREHLERLGWSLDPDLVLFQATAADLGWDERRLRALLPGGIGWDAPMYLGAIASSGLRPGDDRDRVRDALKPRRADILADVYRTVAADAGDRGVPIGWVLLPRVGRPIDDPGRRSLLELADRAGFDLVVDLSDAFDGLDPASIAVGPDDYHPNAEGHAILARRLEAALADLPGVPWTIPTNPSRPGTAGGANRR
jgi:lysophospholipase L1-like esterase